MRGLVVIKVIGVFVMCIVLNACGDREFEDLQRFIKDLDAKVDQNINPLPEVKTFKTFVYGAEKIRDPFTPWVETQIQNRNMVSTSGLHPDFQRRKERLETYPLDTLRMVGTLRREGKLWGIVRAPDGAVHNVQVGNFLGQNHGKITVIGEGKVELSELIEDGIGGWIKRQAFLAIAD